MAQILLLGHLLLLLMFLLIRQSEAAKLVPGVQTLLSHLSLLFIPAGVGILSVTRQDASPMVHRKPSS